jgi:hypothetical protein
VDVVKIKRPEIHLNQLQMDGIMEFEKLWS